MTLKRRIEDATRLYRDFQGMDPDRFDQVAIDMPDPEVALVIGTLHGVSYRAKGDHELYFHKFRSRPLLAVSSDGRQLYILKGGYRFTKRGIIG